MQFYIFGNRKKGAAKFIYKDLFSFLKIIYISIISMRPLVTIAPTAIALGMPVNTQLPFNDSGLLADTLLAPEYRDKVVYVAWEHLQIMNFAKVVLTRLGSDAAVPEWKNSDYDTVFAFHIDWSEPSVRFEVQQQSYGGLPETCPTP